MHHGVRVEGGMAAQPHNEVHVEASHREEVQLMVHGRKNATERMHHGVHIERAEEYLLPEDVPVQLEDAAQGPMGRTMK